MKFLKIVFLLLIASSFYCGAGELDEKTQNRLIGKFKKVRLQLPPGDNSYVPVTLRLADLLAEKGRYLSVKDYDSGCVECSLGISERKEALDLYQSVLPRVNGEQLVTVLAQVGHLQELIGLRKQAEDSYKSILDKVPESKFASEALLSLGEMYFREQDYKTATSYYDQAYNHPNSRRKGYSLYRKAWGLFNLGDYQSAIEIGQQILKDKSLLSRGSDGVDQQFHEEVSRDLATFYSKSGITIKKAEELYKLSPASTALDNIAYLAGELERLGEGRSAVELWSFVTDKESDPFKRLEGFVRQAQLLADLNQRKSSQTRYFQAILLRSEGCVETQKCKEIDSRIKNYVIDWHKIETKNPSQDLMTTYEKFLGVYPSDQIMRVNLAKIYYHYGLWEKSDKAYEQVAQAVIASHEGNKVIEKGIPTLEELALVRIEIGEASKNRDLQLGAYRFYIDKSQERTQLEKVKYQLAYMGYESGDYKKSSQDFKEIALLKSGDKKIRLQAAEMALDALALLKDDASIVKWSSEFLSVFPEKASEFLSLQRAGVLNQTAKLTSMGEFQSAWQKLMSMNVQGADSETEKKYWQNRYVLAEKMHKFAEAQDSLKIYLSLKTLNQDERTSGLLKKAWFAELLLDFKTTYQITKQQMAKEKSPNWLRLALLAELSGNDYHQYFRKFIEANKDSDRSRLLLVRWIKESKEPEGLYKKYINIIEKEPLAASEILYGLYKNKKSKWAFGRILSEKKFASTSAFKVASFLRFERELAGFAKKIENHQLDDKNQRRLSKSLKRRMALLNQGEKLLESSIKGGLWAGQVLAMNQLSVQYLRFYEELMSLPVPEGLTEAEQSQYMALLSEQASPNQVRANALKSKQSELVGQVGVVESYIESISEHKNSSIYDDLVEQVRTVSVFVDEPSGKKLELAISGPSESSQVPAPEMIEIENARKALLEKPLDVAAIDGLMSIENRLGRKTMAEYLRGRKDFARRLTSKAVQSGGESDVE